MSYQILSGSTQVALVTQAFVIEANNQKGPSAVMMMRARAAVRMMSKLARAAAKVKQPTLEHAK